MVVEVEVAATEEAHPEALSRLIYGQRDPLATAQYEPTAAGSASSTASALNSYYISFS